MIRPRRILVINPNTSTSITATFKPNIGDLALPHAEFTYWTSPTGPAMIRSQSDLQSSASQCLPLLLRIADKYDGFLAACYADHPLVHMLRASMHDRPVVGIFDASVLASLLLLDHGSTFGIVTTAAAYEDMLDDSVRLLLGSRKASTCFAGTCASGFGLRDLETGYEHVAQQKVEEATARLIRKSSGNLDVISMGGVILAGMECFVRSTCVREMGELAGRKVKIVDQLRAGALILDASLSGTPLHEVNLCQVLR